MHTNSDDYDFSPGDSSKLAALFGNVGHRSDESNSNLMYTAPKQPNNQRVNVEDDFATPKSKSHSTVLLAKVVSLWKFQVVSTPLPLSIKQEAIASTLGLEMFIEKKVFTTEDTPFSPSRPTLEEKEYKALGKHGLAVIGAVDLNLFEIIAYKERNNVILRTKLNDSLHFYQQKDDFSSFYGDDSKNWLIKFQNDDQKQFCEVIKKFGAQLIANDVESPSKSIEVNSPKPELHPKPKFDAENADIQSDSSGSQRRADILSRMAKMGQQILPKPPQMNNSSDMSDSELEENKFNRKSSPRKLKRHIGNSSRSESMSSNNLDNYRLVPSTSNSISYSPNLNQNVVSPMIYAQPINYEGLNHFIISQNTELKMNVAQLSVKLDSVLTNCTSNKKTDDTTLKSKIKALELKSVNLQEALSNYGNKYNLLEKKYNALSGKDTEELGKMNVVINGLESEISKLKLNLTVAEEQLGNFENLKLELQQSKIDLKDCEKTIEVQKLKLKDYEDFYEHNKNNKDLQVTIDALNDTITNLKLKINDFEKYFRKTESEKQNRQKNNDEKINLLNDMIKMHMNEMYQSVLGSFNEGDSIPYSEVQSEVAKILKGTTFRIIKDLKTIYNDGSNNILNDQ